MDSIKLKDCYFSGSCDLAGSELDVLTVPCRLDLHEHVFECHLPPSEKGLLRGHDLDGQYQITNVSLLYPDGHLFCKHLPIAFAVASSNGDLSNRQTVLRHITARVPRTARLQFALNKPIEFDCNSESTEIIFSPGCDTWGSVEIEDGMTLNGSGEDTSLQGDFDIDFYKIDLAISIAIGAPAKRLFSLKDRKLTVYLNNFPRYGDKKSRPIFFTGEVWRSLEDTRDGIQNLFKQTLDYVKKIPDVDYLGFRNAVNGLMEGRSADNSIELKILAAFYFLEWFDGSKTLSANKVSEELKITREEADYICDVRNAIVHNNKDYYLVIKQGYERGILDHFYGSDRIGNLNQNLAFLDYLYSSLGDALVARIGYQGRTQRYIKS